MKFKKLLSVSTLVAASFLATQAFATIVTLDPQATNGGAGTLSATNPAFPTDKGTTNFASLLDIASTTGTSSFSETGFLDVNEWSITPNTLSGIHDTYFLYATFTISGTGTWLAPNFFSADPGSLTVTANIFGSPGDNTTSGLTYCNPTVGTFGICTAGSQDFLLGTATLQTGISANVTLAGGNLASEVFDGILDFTPAPGTQGPGGFWNSPNPFNVTLNTSATGNAGTPGTTFTQSGGHTFVLTSVTTGTKPIGAGSGNIIFQAFQVPEPSTVALLGVAFLVIGVLRVRSQSGKA